MTRHLTDGELADLYVLDKLPGDEEAEFEERMLVDQQLQQHVETALAIKEALKLEQTLCEKTSGSRDKFHRKNANSWGGLALAASVLLTVVSVVMLARSGHEVDQLERKVAELSRPQTSVLKVPVNIMRSAVSASPEVIVQKPQNGGLIQLDIQLNIQSQTQPSLNFALENEMGVSIETWSAVPASNGHSIVLLRSEQIPVGKASLKISDSDGNILDRRLVEFR